MHQTCASAPWEPIILPGEAESWQSPLDPRTAIERPCKADVHVQSMQHDRIFPCLTELLQRNNCPPIERVATLQEKNLTERLRLGEACKHTTPEPQRISAQRVLALFSAARVSIAM